MPVFYFCRIHLRIQKRLVNSFFHRGSIFLNSVCFDSSGEFTKYYCLVPPDCFLAEIAADPARKKWGLADKKSLMNCLKLIICMLFVVRGNELNWDIKKGFGIKF